MITATVCFFWTRVAEIDEDIKWTSWWRISVGILFLYSLINAIILDWELIKFIMK